ncbi:hypothetical protein [Streptomyces sp. NBC_00328]|uniref:hypothetical protein n=1 Tax=Streptomyces sp. NBC_00328 TaxID=2903646 RepID=UPI002E2B4461|nr:hypothetical protein [Streptomyces sp. NBC_00328]
MPRAVRPGARSSRAARCRSCRRPCQVAKRRDELLVLVRLDGVQGAAEPVLEEHQVVVPVFENLVLDEQVAQVRDGLR